MELMWGDVCDGRREKLREQERERDALVIQPVHDELLHALHRIVERGVRDVSPDVGLAHLMRDELRARG